jgi:hypothetical protein
MHGVTTALVSFLFVCVVFPNLIKNRAQYYAAFAIVCLVIALDALGVVISGPTVEGHIAGFRVLVYFFVALLQVGAMVLLFLSAGGITWRALAGDMKDAIEVIRRGGEEKEVIIPLSGEMSRRAAERRAEADEPAPRIVIDDEDTLPTGGQGAPPRPSDAGSLPLEQ